MTELAPSYHPTTEASCARHELAHGIGFVVAAKLIAPSLISPMRLLISVQDAEHGECAILGLDPDEPLTKRIAALGSLAPISLLTSNQVKEILRSKRLFRKSILSPSDLRIAGAEPVSDHDQHACIIATHAYFALLGKSRLDEICSIIIDTRNKSEKSVEIHASDLVCPDRLAKAVYLVPKLARAATLGQKWKPILTAA